MMEPTNSPERLILPTRTAAQVAPKGGEDRGPWIATYPTKTEFHPMDPRPEDVHIEDIAQALSLTCRYGGFLPRHYSVAQHSVLVSELCWRKSDGDPAVAFWGLLHDAAEAYVGDLIWPLKQIPDLAGPFRRLEEPILRVIAEKFGLTWPMPPLVKWADACVLLAETRDQLLDPAWARERVGGPAIEPWPDWKVDPWNAESARVTFLGKFEELRG